MVKLKASSGGVSSSFCFFQDPKLAVIFCLRACRSKSSFSSTASRRTLNTADWSFYSPLIESTRSGSFNPTVLPTCSFLTLSEHKRCVYPNLTEHDTCSASLPPVLFASTFLTT